MSTSDREYGDPETRKRILESALEVAVELGPSMRLADVSTRAGISHQGLYLHFRGRDALLVALLNHMVKAFDVHARYERVVGAPNGIAALEAMVDHLGFLNSKLDSIGWVLEEAQHLDEGFGRDWRRRMTGIHHAIEQDVITRLAEDGSLKPEWSHTDAANLFLAVTTLGTWRDVTRQLGWSHRDYKINITRILTTSLVVG